MCAVTSSPPRDRDLFAGGRCAVVLVVHLPGHAVLGPVLEIFIMCLLGGWFTLDYIGAAIMVALRTLSAASRSTDADS
jgi:hypothetical protein